jgi:hypothetical protein
MPLLWLPTVRLLATLLTVGALACLFCATLTRAQPDEIDGCSEPMYLDRTAVGADRTLHWDFGFITDEERCITVRVGQTVSWEGSFADHPLDPDEGDVPNPIANHVNGVVRFDQPGTFGYRCNFHAQMRGAIRVLPAASAVPWAGPAGTAGLATLLVGLLALVLRRTGLAGAANTGSVRALMRRCVEPTLLLLLALCLGHVLGPARHGTPDSATYLSAAQHLAHGDGYVTSALDDHGRMEPLTWFAPLFSLLIASDLVLREVSVHEALSDVMLLSFALFAGGCYALFRTLLPTRLRRWAFVCAFTTLFLPGSVSCLRGALSDLLGAGLALFACAYFLKHAPDLRRGALLSSASLFALAISARWSNIYFALAAALALSCASGASYLSRARRAFALTFCSALLVSPLWLRNLLEAGSAMGPRPFSPSNPLLHGQRAFLGLAQPLLALRTAWADRPALAELLLAVGLICTAGLVALWLTRRDPRGDRGLVLVLSYALLLVGSSSTTQLDPLDEARFWLPVLPLLAALACRTLATAHYFDQRTMLSGLSMALLVLVVGRNGLAVARESILAPARSGLFAPRYASSPVVQRTLSLFDQGRCSLAGSHVFWLFPHLGMRPITWLTRDSAAPSAARPTCVVLLRERTVYNTDSAALRARLLLLSRSARAQLLESDELAELWWTPGSDDSSVHAGLGAQHDCREHASNSSPP